MRIARTYHGARGAAGPLVFLEDAQRVVPGWGAGRSDVGHPPTVGRAVAVLPER